MSEEYFNNWLEAEYGYEDLYLYFTDKVTPDMKKSDLDELVNIALQNVPRNLKEAAEDAGYDITGICYQAFKDCIMY